LKLNSDTLESRGEGEKSYLPYILLGVATFIPAVFVRLALITGKGVNFGAIDLHGFLSDFAVSLFVALLLVLLLGLKVFRRASVIVVLIIWSLSNYGAYEHVMALGALPALDYAGYLTDRTFLGGSVLAISNPLLLFFVLALPIAIFLYTVRGEGLKLKYPVFLIIAFVVAFISLVWEQDHASLIWRQANFIDDNLRRIAVARSDLKTTGVEGVGDTELARSIAADLNGSPLIEVGNKGQNVLLIMLEGVSGGYVDGVSKHQGVSSPLTLPSLSRIAEEKINFTNFISNQRHTSRGEYAVLCGDYPKLLTLEPRVNEIVRAASFKPCLPEVLRDAGYETVYLQSAPLAFMMKDQFMPKIGFTKVYGDSFFTKSYSRNRWGVDDRAYFEKSVEVIKELSSKKKPWFMTMLTVGTHDPYNVPDSFRSKYSKGSFSHAMSYLDLAFGDFIDTLDAEGLLKDTLVLITSDESAGMVHPNNLVAKLSQNWGLLVGLIPGKKSMRIDESFMQVDIALSVLDYLGLADKDGGFIGRSFFRAYEDRRHLFFGNTYRHFLGVIEPSGLVSICDEGFGSCGSYATSEGRAFSPELKGIETSEAAVEMLKVMAARSKESVVKEKGYAMDLFKEDSVGVAAEGLTLVLGGQQLFAPAGSLVELDFELKAEGGKGQVTLLHKLASREITDDTKVSEHFITSTPAMSSGDSYKLKYSYFTEKKLDKIEVLLFARTVSGAGMELVVEKARLKVTPGAEGKESGVRETLILLNGVSLGAPKLY
jgi:phosphoglycerol transferase MdoB-like AlkP superfamily enzyme